MLKKIECKTVGGRMTFILRTGLIGLLSFNLAVSPAMAAISQNPMFVGLPTKPNIMFTLDNSGSMNLSWLSSFDGQGMFYNPDGKNSAQFRLNANYSSSYNLIYYNPAIYYKPPIDMATWKEMPNATPSAAQVEPFNADILPKYTVDLTSTCFSEKVPVLPSYAYPSYPIKDDEIAFQPEKKNCLDKASGSFTVPRARYAFYYVWDSAKYPNLSKLSPGSTDPAFPADKRVDIINNPVGKTFPKLSPNRIDCNPAECTYAQEIQNFANWFSFYRTRILMGKTVVGRVFNQLDDQYRVGFNTINWIDAAGKSGTNNNAVIDGKGWLTIRDYDTVQKKKFFERLYAINPNGNTPLRTQANRIGKLFMDPNKGLSGFDYKNEDPYYDNQSSKNLLACRSNYHILTTDGFWNDDSGMTNFPTVGNTDGGESRPFKDANGQSNTLADVTQYYWKQDLRSDLTGTQNLVTFTVGLGASGLLQYKKDYEESPTGDFADIKAGAKEWPVAKSDDPTGMDDLWHAAVNGRGRYFNTGNPDDLTEGLLKVFATIASANASGGGVASNTGRAGSADGLVYMAGFESGLWLGHLKAYPINKDGKLGPAVWDAATRVPAPANRNIATMLEQKDAVTSQVSLTPTKFEYANFTDGSAQKLALGSQDVLNYIRGDDSKEIRKGGSFRNRTMTVNGVVTSAPLGDIVNSPVLYVKGADNGYSRLPLSEVNNHPYRDYLLKTKAKREPLLFAGANDGMLHAFGKDTSGNEGVERFAFIPAAVYPNLKSLSDPSYSHKYFVDGPLVEGDAFSAKEDKWKTYVVGTTGAGGKSVFGIDATNTAALSAAWEINPAASGFENLGYVLGKPIITRLKGPKPTYVAIFGNGYGSASGRASLYVVDVLTGKKIREFVVPTGNVDAPNGLGAPALIYDVERNVMTAYAGDLQGHIWKFPLQKEDLKAAGTYIDVASLPAPTQPLFSMVSAETPDTAAHWKTTQPITVRPEINLHPEGGYVLTFGTGKYYETTDPTDVAVQSIYGIWDKDNKTTIYKTDLKKGELIERSPATVPKTYDVTMGAPALDWKTNHGWYFDLKLKTGVAEGERVIGELFTLDNSTVLIPTFTPIGTGVCSGSGSSKLFAIRYTRGLAGDVFPHKPGEPAPAGMDTGGTKGGAFYDVPRNGDGDGQPKGDVPGCRSDNCVVCRGMAKNRASMTTDGRTDVLTLRTQCRPPLRTWHQLPYNY